MGRRLVFSHCKDVYVYLLLYSFQRMRIMRGRHMSLFFFPARTANSFRTSFFNCVWIAIRFELRAVFKKEVNILSACDGQSRGAQYSINWA